MELYDITSLTRDTNQDNLYDLFTKTFVESTTVPKTRYVVKQDQTMRMDLICQDIYGSVEYVDFLLNFNNIDNPLNIKSGDEIFYTSIDIIDTMKSSEPSEIKAIKKFTNPSKSTRKDPTRKDFLEQGFTLPPNFLDAPQAPIRIEGDTLVIG